MENPFKFILLALLLSFVQIGCVPKGEKDKMPGMAISFDDHFIEEWYALRPVFEKYNAKVTFFVTCSDSLTPREVNLLKQLQNDGHEIGYHGTVHSRSTELIAAFGPQGYKEQELSPGLSYMENAGFKPTSYAHPGGNHNPQVDSVLFSMGFKILRDVAISRRKVFGIPIYTMAPRIMPWIYYSFDNTPLVDALLIDTDSGLTMKEMKDAIATAKNNRTTLMLFGHEPLNHKPINGEYGFDIQFLESILKEAKHQGLNFYTMSELME